MFKKINITCDEATTICDKSQYGEASLYEKIKLNLHLFICKICALYSKQNSKMTHFYKIKSTNCKKETNCLSKAEKEVLKKQFKNIER